jgi:hypothetical protein
VRLRRKPNRVVYPRQYRQRWGHHETVDATVNSNLGSEIIRRLNEGRERNAQWARDHAKEQKP